MQYISINSLLNKKESKTVLDPPHLLLHLLPHPVLEKKRIARKKEMKSSKPTMSRKNIPVLRESTGQEEPFFELGAEEEPEEFLLEQILVPAIQILLFKRDRRKRNGILNILQKARNISCMMTEMMV